MENAHRTYELTGPRDKTLAVFRKFSGALLRSHTFNRSDLHEPSFTNDELVLQFRGYVYILRDCVRLAATLVYAEPLVKARTARITLSVFGGNPSTTICRFAAEAGWQLNRSVQATKPTPAPIPTPSTFATTLVLPDDLAKSWHMAREKTGLGDDELFRYLFKGALDRRNLYEVVTRGQMHHSTRSVE